MVNTYKNIQYRLDDFEDNNEVDTAGYFGTDHRTAEKFSKNFIHLTDISVIVRAIYEDNKLPRIMKTIRSIDREKNGYVTNQELEDIIKLHYPDQLKQFEMKALFKNFAS